MKKFLSLVAVMAVAVMMSSTSWATLTPIKKTAKATFATSTLEFTVTLYDWVSGKDYQSGYETAADYISFDTAAVTQGITTSQWSSANTFAKIHSNLTTQTAATTVLIFTNNQSSTDYKANAPRVESSVNKYNGLVRKGMSTTYKAGDYAPLEMKCVLISTANTNYKTSKPTEFAKDGQMDAGERYLLDEKDGNWDSAGEQGQCIGKGGIDGGIWVGYGKPGGTGTESNWYSKTEDVIVFFGARFESVVGGDDYGTDKITFAESIE